MDPKWKNKNYSFYQNSKCEYFPCHKMENITDFNCLFCYCPLYALGEHCGGNFRFNEKGYKDCTNCILPHQRKNYGYVNEKFQEIANLIRKNREE
ncbi:MAG: cysteine-rich small domain-containing protein [Eubacteriales bacterium]